MVVGEPIIAAIDLANCWQTRTANARGGQNQQRAREPKVLPGLWLTSTITQNIIGETSFWSVLKVHLDPELESDEITTKRLDNVKIDTILSNSFGFGGTNATIALSKYQD